MVDKRDKNTSLDKNCLYFQYEAVTEWLRRNHKMVECQGHISGTKASIITFLFQLVRLSSLVYLFHVRKSLLIVFIEFSLF